MSLQEQLGQNRIFEGFSQDDLGMLASLMEEMKYQDGELILSETAEPSSNIFFILSGKVQIFKHVSGIINILTVLDKNDIFGEVAFVDRKMRSASAKALGPVTLALLRYEHFNIIKKQAPALGMDFLMCLMGELTRKFRAVNEGLDIKSPEYAMQELVSSSQQVMVTTKGGGEYTCTIVSADRSPHNPFMKLDVKGQTILLPLHEVKSIIFPNRYGKFLG